MREDNFDYWEKIQGVVDGPTGNGGRTTTLANIVTRAGTRVLLHAIVPLAGATGNVTILHADGTTAYFTTQWPTPANPNGAAVPIDIELTDGLTMGGGSAGAWLVSFKYIR